MAVQTNPRSPSWLSTIGIRIRSIPAGLRARRVSWRIIIPALVIVVAGAAVAYYRLVYIPAQSTVEAPLQTTTATRGDLTVSATGTGILQPSTQVQLGFGTSGKIASLDVKVGDTVKTGQLLAELDDTQTKVKYEQAERALANLTSKTAVAQAQEDVATATSTLTNSKYALMYIISPQVFYDDEQILADQQAVAAAKSAGGTTPTQTQQKAIDDAKAAVAADQQKLAGDQVWYQEHYLPTYFTVIAANPTVDEPNHRPKKNVEPPSQVEIDTAQANYDVAKAALQQAQWYLDALNGKDVPANAGGTNLTNLQNARFAVETAKANLDGSQIHSTMDGIVTSVSAEVGDNVKTTPVIVVGDLNKLYLKTYVKEKDYQKFTVGNATEIVFDALPGQTFKGKVIQVDPGLDTSTSTSVVSGLVEMDQTNTKLLMGMSAAVNIIIGRTNNAVLVPLAALHEYTPGQYAVFVMHNGHLTVDFVEVGLKNQTVAEIKSGLQPGDVVSTGIVGTK